MNPTTSLSPVQGRNTGTEREQHGNLGGGKRGAQSRAGGSSVWDRTVAKLDAIAISPWFAYLSVALIQLKVMGGIWTYRDLTAGDTSQYFSSAAQWTNEFTFNAVWSPAYQTFFGVFQWVFAGVYGPTIAHRIFIAVATTLTVLAVMRRLLTPGIAWLLAVWWALIGAHFDVLYEVYLFPVPIFAIAVVFALSRRDLLMRSTVFGVLVGLAVLVRLEFVVAAIIWGVAWLCLDVRRWRRGRAEPTKRLAVAFAAPVVIVALLGTVVAVRAGESHEPLIRGFETRQSLSVCQSYAFNYVERHSDFSGDPVANCGKVMQREFGEKSPSLVQAITEQPGEMAAQTKRNLELFPYSLQVLFFNGISGSRADNPDYIEVNTDSTLAGIGSVSVLALLVAGFALGWPERRYWWSKFIRPRAWGWLALASGAAAAIWLGIVARPRPEYLFVLALAVLGVLGTCGVIVAKRLPRISDLRSALPLVAAMLLLAWPSYFNESYTTPQTEQGRPLKELVSRLAPFKSKLSGSDTRVLLPRYPTEACFYVSSEDPCSGRPLSKAIERMPGNASPARWLGNRGFNFVYLDEFAAVAPSMSLFRERLKTGWRELAGGTTWVLLENSGDTSD